jgi:hypothetical protein
MQGELAAGPQGGPHPLRGLAPRVFQQVFQVCLYDYKQASQNSFLSFCNTYYGLHHHPFVVCGCQVHVNVGNDVVILTFTQTVQPRSFVCGVAGY